MSTRITTKALPFAVAIMATASLLTHAAPGDLDPTFGTGGWVTTPVSANPALPNEIAFGVGLQSDDKIVVAGYVQRGAPNLRMIALARYTTAGVLDTTFGAAGTVTTAVGGIDNAAQSMTIQSDDKIVVAGFAEVTGNGYDFSLARYTANGSLDGTFGSGGIVNTVFHPHSFPISSHAAAVLAMDDGRILAAGNADLTSTDLEFALARYQSNGSLDTSFDGDGKVTTNVAVPPPFFEGVEEIVIQPDGKIVAAGYSPDGGATYDFAVARFNTDGSLDTGFGSGGTTTIDPGVGQAQALGVALQSIGGESRIVVAGYTDNGTYNDITLVRYLPDGSLDATFGTGGIVTTDAGASSLARGVSVDAAGRIVVVGTVGPDFAVAVYDAAGALDPSFGTAGIAVTDLGVGEGDVAYALALQPDGKIVAAGYSDRSTTGTDLDLAVARYEGFAIAAVPALSRGAAAFLVVLAFVALGYAVFRIRGSRARIGDIRLSP